MNPIMVRYKVKADRADENARYITAVFEQLTREKPEGLRYAAFRFDDGVSFVHLVSVTTSDGPHPLTELDTFKAFVAEIRDRCEEPPTFAELNPVGTYNLFGDSGGNCPSR